MRRPRVLKCGRHNWIVRVNERRVASEPTDLVDLGITGRDFRYTIVFIRRCVVVIYGHR